MVKKEANEHTSLLNDGGYCGSWGSQHQRNCLCVVSLCTLYFVLLYNCTFILCIFYVLRRTPCHGAKETLPEGAQSTSTGSIRVKLYSKYHTLLKFWALFYANV